MSQQTLIWYESCIVCTLLSRWIQTNERLVQSTVLETGHSVRQGPRLKFSLPLIWDKHNSYTIYPHIGTVGCPTNSGVVWKCNTSTLRRRWRWTIHAHPFYVFHEFITLVLISFFLNVAIDIKSWHCIESVCYEFLNKCYGLSCK